MKHVTKLHERMSPLGGVDHCWSCTCGAEGEWLRAKADAMDSALKHERRCNRKVKP